MTVKPPAPPPLPDELEALLRRLRLPYVRKAAPEVIATRPRSGGSTPRCCACCSPRRPPAATRQPPRCGGGPPGCRPAKRSTPGSSKPRRSPSRPSRRSERWNGSSAQRSCRLWPVRHRQEPLRRGARASRDRQRQDGRVAHARDARATRAPPPRRRQRHQSDRQADPRRSDHHRRCRPAPGLHRRRRSAIPGRRRRLRETIDRDSAQTSTRPGSTS